MALCINVSLVRRAAVQRLDRPAAAATAISGSVQWKIIFAELC